VCGCISPAAPTCVGRRRGRQNACSESSRTAQKAAVSILSLWLLLAQSITLKADWKSDANARIEANRKTSAEITVRGSGNNPVPDVSIDIQQVKHRFAFGTCIAYSPLYNTANYRNFILSHFEWAVCENESKWPANEPSRDSETYTQADYIYNWCHSNGIEMRGHCLFWEQTTSVPSWVQSLSPNNCSDLQVQVNERIDHAVAHFAGKFHHWDVDNEMLNNDFYGTCLGDQGRANMFIRAHQVDPDCNLFMNEYNGNSFGGYSATAYVSRTLNLISLGAPIHGIGIQAHVASPFDPQSYWTNVLEPLRTGLGLQIWATEYDSSTTDVNQRATDLDNFYRICFSHPSVGGILMWGFWDGSQWRDNAQLVETDWTINAAGLKYESLLNEWTTHDANVTNSSGKADFRGFQGTYQITLSKSGETTEIHTIVLEPNSSTVQFTIDTNFIAGPPDTTPPTPNPMTWASNPAATGPNSITMTATTASDISGVEYFFDCLTTGGHDSSWQLSPTYTDTNLSPNTQYTYQVQARDKSANHNTTAFSVSRSATTWPPDTAPPTPNPMTWAAAPAATGAYTITMTASTAADTNSPPVQYYFECTTNGDFNSVWQSSPTYLASGLTPSTLYTFRVRARDSAPALNTTGWSSSLSATTSAAPTNISILGSWVAGTTHAKEAGGNRALIFIAHGELTSAMNLTSVTYGGQAMTKVLDFNYSAASGCAYAAAFILNETGVAAATTSTFTTIWSGITPTVYGYSSAFFSNVDQTTSIGATGTGGSTTNPVTTSALATSSGDMVILGATCGNSGSYTLNNSFTEGNDQTMSSTATGVTGYKHATGATETPSATYSSTINRQMIIGFVLRAGVPVDTAPAAPAGLVATAGNKSIILTWNSNSEADMNGYNVYRSATPGGGYAKLNGSLLTNTNYTDNGLTNGVPYYYVVTAVDKAGHESSNSSEATATPAYQSCADAIADGHRLAADINGSGNCYVDLDDLYTLASFWLRQDCSTNNNCDGADFVPRDGVVDFLDFSDLAEQWLTCNDPANPNCTPNW